MRKNMLNNNRPKASSNSLLVCDNRSPRKREREREREIEKLKEIGP